MAEPEEGPAPASRQGAQEIGLGLAFLTFVNFLP